MGIIAGKFEISLYDILAINNLVDPNNLSIGQTLLIPTGPLPTLTLTYTPTPSVAPSGTATPRTTHPPTLTPSPTLQAPVVTIQSILGVGDLATERVNITLTGSSEISLTAWQLIDEAGHAFIFPQLDLFPDGSIQVNTRSGINSATELFWGLEAATWKTGETAQLLDASGNVRATFQVP